MTMRTTVRAAAKINLFLDITGKRSDGYHIVNMVMQSVSLYDEVTVTIEKGDGEINVSCTDESIPCDETNTAYQAVKAFFEYAQIKPKNVWVKIKKRIPSQAGMAGGSTDAAAVLVALNEMLDTGFSQDELAEIAENIGADVPFCIYGGTMTANGIGTILTPLPEMPECYIVVVKPDIKISTKEAYEKSDSMGYEQCRSVESMADAICRGDIKAVGKALYNKFEEVADIREIDDIKSMMKQSGALGALMTGSGSAVFGIFDDEDKADECKSRLSEKYNEIFIVHPVPNGPSQIVHGRIIGSLLK